ncbi:MAG: zinc ribbon domain-containing protein [candidate division WOR-3 bacterium]|nr:zinc ribbon domain-containing protein [candidate division WOR-3 bacterium]
MKSDFQSVIFNAIKTKFTGRLIFVRPEGGVVRVLFVEGKIKDVDSTWGYGSKELERIREWQESSVITKEISEKELEKYRVLPDIVFKFTCPDCGHEIPIDVNFCPECGYQIRNVKVCLNCGFENPSDAKFCEKCGNKFYLEQITKNIKICPNCSSSIQKDAKFCPECGHSFLKICPRCKSENQPNVKFCEECGYEFKSDKLKFSRVLIPTFILTFFILILGGIFMFSSDTKTKVLQAPNVIQEFVTFNNDEDTSKRTTKITKKEEVKKQLVNKNIDIDTSQIIEQKIEKKIAFLKCETESLLYYDLKIKSVSFDFSKPQNLPYYKQGPISLDKFDTLIVDFESLAGLLRSRNAILLVVSNDKLSYLDTHFFTQNTENFEAFVKNGFNLPFPKSYVRSKGRIVFSSSKRDEYYIVVINEPYLEKETNKLYLKTKTLVFNLKIKIKRCFENKNVQ